MSRSDTNYTRTLSCDAESLFDKSTIALSPEILGKGSQALVFESTVTLPDGRAILCAAKKNPSSCEIDANGITHGFSSKQLGLLKFIGLFKPKKSKEEVSNEGNALMKVLSGNLIKMLNCQETQSVEAVTEEVYAIFPRCQAMLKDLLPNIHALHDENNAKHKYFPHIILNILDFLICGLETLQTNEIVHGDISLGNMALRITETNEVMFVLIDLGLAKKYEDFKKGEYCLQGTPFFIAPEIAAANLDKSPSSSLICPEAIDVYSAGCLLNQCITLQKKAVNSPPFVMIADSGAKYEATRQEDKSNGMKEKQRDDDWLKRMESETTFDQCIGVLIAEMCQILPEKRSTLEEIKKAQTILHTKWPALLVSEEKELFECYQNLLKVIHNTNEQNVGTLSINSIDNHEVESPMKFPG